MTEPGHERDLQPVDAHEALQALVDVAVRLSAAERLAPSTAETALQAIADAGAAALHVAAASIALHDQVSGELVFRAAAGPQGQGVIGLAIAPHEGIAGYVFSTGQPLAVADVTRDARFERGTAEQTGYVPRSLLAVPLVDDEGIIGVMEWLDRSDGSPFDLADLDWYLSCGRSRGHTTFLASSTLLGNVFPSGRRSCHNSMFRLKLASVHLFCDFISRASSVTCKRVSWGRHPGNNRVTPSFSICASLAFSLPAALVLLVSLRSSS